MVGLRTEHQPAPSPGLTLSEFEELGLLLEARLKVDIEDRAAALTAQLMLDCANLRTTLALFLAAMSKGRPRAEELPYAP